MASKMEKLPLELKYAIFEAILDTPRSDLLNLRFTSRAIRDDVAPYFYRQINLTNYKTSATLCQNTAKDACGDYVHHLHFVCDAERVLSRIAAREDFILPEVLGVLSTLHRFPNLKKLSVRFTSADQTWRSFVPCADDYADVDVIDQIEMDMRKSRGIMLSKTFQAIANNKPGVIQILEYHDASFKFASSWFGDDFRAFLSTLTTFTVSFHSSPKQFKSARIPEYHNSVDAIHKVFICRVDNLTTLSITAPERGVIGGKGIWQASYPLSPDDCPHLKHLQLGHIFIDDLLLQFILSHKDKLETIRMTNAYSEAIPNEALSWGDCFDQVACASPSKLKSWDIAPSIPSLKRLERDRIPNEIWESAQAMMDEKPWKSMFAYAYVDEWEHSHTFAVTDDEQTIAHYLGNDDMKHWEILQSIMAKNSAIDMIVRSITCKVVRHFNFHSSCQRFLLV